jgi:hypothetical protein
MLAPRPLPSLSILWALVIVSAVACSEATSEPDATAAPEDTGSSVNEPAEPDVSPGDLQEPDTTPKEVKYSVTGTPENLSGESANRIWLQSRAEGPRTLAVDVMASTESVMGLAFRLRFDPSALAFTGHEDLDSFTDKSAEQQTLVRATKPGELAVGCARFVGPGADDWPLPGKQLFEAKLITLRFDILAAGESALTFAPTGREVRDGKYESRPAAWYGVVLSVDEVTP